MFRDTRRETLRNRVILAALGVLIMTFGIWLNYRGEEPSQQSEETANKVSAAEEPYAEQDKELSAVETEKTPGSDESQQYEASGEQEGTDTESVPEAYLIKEMDGVVKVFLCHDDGSRELYLITSIPYELLSESDQQLLRDGVRIKTEDDLGKFLENFDS